MSHDPISAWRREHADYAKLLDLLERELVLLEREGQPNYTLMLDVLTYLCNQPDRHHHPREDAVFQRLAALNPSFKGQVADLHQEHAALASMGEEVRRKLENVVGGGMASRETLSGAIREYFTYYRNHIAAEEQAVIPAAAKLLSAEDWEAANTTHPAALDPLFGSELDERYRDLRRAIEGESAG